MPVRTGCCFYHPSSSHMSPVPLKLRPFHVHNFDVGWEGGGPVGSPPLHRWVRWGHFPSIDGFEPGSVPLGSVLSSGGTRSSMVRPVNTCACVRMSRANCTHRISRPTSNHVSRGVPERLLLRPLQHWKKPAGILGAERCVRARCVGSWTKDR